MTALVLGWAGVSSADLRVLAKGQVVVATIAPSTSTVPVDGEMRGPDAQAVVTAVAWPYDADGYVAGSGQRLVAFSVQLTEATSDVTGFGSTGPTLSLLVQGSPQSLDTSAIDSGVGDSSGATGTGTESYVASVPNDTESVDVSMTDLGYTQSFSLWSLERTTPAPAVLYDDPTSSSVTDQIGVTKQLTIHDPSFGDNVAEVFVASAQLSAFNPAGTDETAPPGHAYLVLSMVANSTQGELYADNYIESVAPLPGSSVKLTVGRHHYLAQRSAGPQPAAGSSDDGMLDATYAFLVPADTTHGIVSIGPAHTSGQTYDNYLDSGPVDPMTVSGPVSFSVGFPKPSPIERQPSPPWWSEPVPSSAPPKKSGTAGLPIAVAIALLALLVVVIVMLRRKAVTLSSRAPRQDAPTAPQPNIPVSESPSVTLRIDFLGPVRVAPLDERPGEFARAFLCYLAVHDDRPRTVDDVQTALWPMDSTERDVSRKTFLNYVSDVRRLVSAEHLPATPKRATYRLSDVATDWGEFRGLAAAAEHATGSSGHSARERALALVRGVPFESELSKWFQWTDSEGIRSAITRAVVKVALDAYAERVQAGDLVGADWSLRQGLRCHPTEPALWECLADVVQARADRGDEQRFWRDAEAVLGADEVRHLRERVRG